MRSYESRSKIRVVRAEPLSVVPFAGVDSEQETREQNNTTATRRIALLFFLPAIFVGVISGVLVGGKSHNTAPKATTNSFDILSGIPELSRMWDGVKFTGIADQLRNEAREPVSIMAPTSEAFQNTSIPIARRTFSRSQEVWFIFAISSESTFTRAKY